MKALPIVLACCGLLSAACSGGEATVSGPPIENTQTSTSSEESVTTQRAAAVEVPQAVEAVDATEQAAGQFSPQEQAFLDALRDAGVQPDETADGLVAAASTVCRVKSTGGEASESTLIANAVAGQIVAGGYSQKTEKEVSTLIINYAGKNICP